MKPIKADLITGFGINNGGNPTSYSFEEEEDWGTA
jgi:hypothetical protein